MICGGTMSGNCATGSARIDDEAGEDGDDGDDDGDDGTANEEGGHGSASVLHAGRALGVGFRGVDERARLDHLSVAKLRRVDDDAIARREPFRHDEAAADAVAERHRADADLAVGVDDADLRCALQLGDRALRNEQRVADDLRFGADARRTGRDGGCDPDSGTSR